MDVAVGFTAPSSCSGLGRGMGAAVLCMSSIRFTLDVLDLVLMDGAGDGEMGGEGESSPAITGSGRIEWPDVLLVLQAEVGSALWVRGVAPYSSTRDSVSSSCCVSGWVLGWARFVREDLTGSASLVPLGFIGGGFRGWVHGGDRRFVA